MKKIISLLAAGALALGLMSCSGDLHDKGISPLYIEGTAWGRTALTVVDDTTQEISFTYNNQTGWDAKANEIHFKIIDAPSGWVNDFGGDDKEVFILKMNDELKEVHSRKNEELPDTKHIVIQGLDVGKEYKITIKYIAADNKLSVGVSGDEPIETNDMFLLQGSDLVKMEMVEKNISYTTTITGDGSVLNFKLFNGEKTFGLTTAGEIPSEATELVENGKAMSLTTVNERKYLLNVTVSEDGDVTAYAVPALLNYKYGLTKLRSNFGDYDLDWEAVGDNMKAVVTIPVTATNGWGADNEGIFSFGITGEDDWTTKFTGAVLGNYSSAAELKLGADSNNIAKGVVTSNGEIVVTLVSSDTKVTCAVTNGAAPESLWYSEGIKYLRSNVGDYPLIWEKDGSNYKAVVTVKAGTEMNDWGVANSICFGLTLESGWDVKYTGATVTAANTPVECTKDAGANNVMSVTTADKDVVITVKSTARALTVEFKK